MNFSNMKITVLLDKESFMKVNYRPFIAGMAAVFIMKIVTLMGIAIPLF